MCIHGALLRHVSKSHHSSAETLAPPSNSSLTNTCEVSTSKLLQDRTRTHLNRHPTHGHCLDPCTCSPATLVVCARVLFCVQTLVLWAKDDAICWFSSAQVMQV
jgi:hypothetical protein